MLFGLTPLGGATAGPAAGPNPGTTAPGTTGVNRTERSRAPRKKWIAPEGTSLRSVIESKERQVGLRCDDVSCLYGPEDGDEENADVKIRTERTCLRKNPGSAEPSCMHTYHPECLLVASRVADIGLDREMDSDGPDEWLEVGCPFCRVHGGQEKREWRNHRELASRV
ncbi:hypothetical protein M408DRAFT_77542 [Serendipita vermifera MAFF 305830]|uniref:RING-type domain-containing protein n=1 Tax=Serendipita vermifera MAFF 305830 TaxID=933852 RepID=A0A0C3AW11_SERVB|nr:hypothetical protein M408DRAFT_77542 [Serendipita vermifera MAFF 305830]